MFVQPKIFSKKKRPSISDFNKYLINSIENKTTTGNTNKSFVISTNNILNSIKPFNNPNKKLLLEKLDTSNFHKSHKAKDKSFCNYNTINYDNSEDLIMAQKLSSSIMSERYFFNSNIYYNKYNMTKEKTSSTFDNDIIEASPLEIYNRKMEYLSHVIKIQSFWRKYTTWKKVRFYKFFGLIEKTFYKNNIYYIKLFFKKLTYSYSIKDVVYYKKIPEKNIIKRNIKFHIIKCYQNNMLKTGEKKGENSKKEQIISKSYKKIKSKNWWIKLPLTLEKYIKNKIINLYSLHFFENLKEKEKEILKQRQNKILHKLINLNDKKILRKYMNIYKEKTINKKQKPKIYYSLIKSKSRTNKKAKIFNFQSFYKKNILEDIIKKYRYTSIIQKYYLLWKKETEDNKISKNKKKKIIRIKKVKNNFESKNDLNILKEDTFNNVSEISNNISISSNNTLNSIQSIKGMKKCLTSTNKKMKIKRIAVDQNYYKYIGNNNNYNNV